MIRLERRPQPSRLWVWCTPPLAVALTMLAGGLMFAASERSNRSIRTISSTRSSTRNSPYSRPQLLVKAGPLILIAIGLSLGLNIGAEASISWGRFVGCSRACPLSAGLPIVFPAMVLAGCWGDLHGP